MIIELYKKDLEDNKIVETICMGETNIDIFLKDNVTNYNQTDFDNYKNLLTKIANEIIHNYPSRIISVNVLTDIFTAKRPTIDKEFYFCQICPCYCCPRDKELFKESTYDEFTPPTQYCQKSFIELSTSKYICDALQLPFDMSDINFQSYQELIYTLHGTDTRRDKWLTRE